jgi:hypothetical protein
MGLSVKDTPRKVFSAIYLLSNDTDIIVIGIVFTVRYLVSLGM